MKYWVDELNDMGSNILTAKTYTERDAAYKTFFAEVHRLRDLGYPIRVNFVDFTVEPIDAIL